LLKIILLKISLGKRRVLSAKDIPLEESMVLHEADASQQIKRESGVSPEQFPLL
jgi:hypothetical protein